MEEHIGMSLDRLEAELKGQEADELPISLEELCERYEALYTGCVNDVLRENALLDQVLPKEILPLTFEMKTAGIAFTIRSTRGVTIEGELEKRAEMIDAMPRHAMVVWDTGQDEESAHWGEMMTASALDRGARGAVIDGGIRDTHQILDQDFPVFHKYRTSNGTLGRSTIVDYNLPVRVGKVIIRPGDILLGDIDGVVVVPRHLAYEVLQRAEEIEQNEKVIKSWMQDGLSAQEVVDRGGYF